MEYIFNYTGNVPVPGTYILYHLIIYIYIRINYKVNSKEKDTVECEQFFKMHKTKTTYRT